MLGTVNQAYNALREKGLLFIFRRGASSINGLFYRGFSTNPFNLKGDNIFDKDWDNLVILDACRYDAFRKVNHLSGQLESHYSLGSCSSEFVRANFRERELHDVVVVSANGWYKKIKEEYEGVDVHDLIIVSNGDTESAVSSLDTVRPDREWILPHVVTNRAREAIETYPNKRIVVHYQQPHTPYIGPTAEKYAGEIPKKFDGREKLGVSHDILWQAYYENLEIVLAEVEELASEIVGKTIISADHGDLLGERGFPIPARQYGHPKRIYRDELVKVPWFELSYEERKEITTEPPVEDTGDDLSMEDINERLESLGYKV